MIRRSLLDAVLPLIARLFASAELLVAARGKIIGWQSQADYMTRKGMHFVTPLLAAALLIEAIGALLVIVGLRTRAAAAVLFVYLGIVTVRLHAFWFMSGDVAGANEGEFFKNLGIMSGLLMIALYGGGRWTLDRRLRNDDE
jgi:putative oxidoreductase